MAARSWMMIEAEIYGMIPSAKMPILAKAPPVVWIDKGRSTKKNRMNTNGDEYDNAAMDKRRAYSWLVRNNKALKHTLAQRMSHMKTCPDLTFAQVDVAAAVDVMYLIDKVSSGYKRESIGEYVAQSTARFDGDEDDDEYYVEGEEDEDGDWEDEDDEFF